MRTAVVIGGGAIGVASAYFLARDGWSVTLVERGEIGRACSFGNCCLIVPSHSEPIPGPGVVLQGLKWMARGDSPFYVRPRLDISLLRFLWAFRMHCTADAAEAGFRALLALSRRSLELYEELLGSGEIEFFFERRGLVEVFLSPESRAAARRSKEHLASHGFCAKLLTRDEAIDLEPALAPTIEGGLFIEGEAHGYGYGYVRSLARGAERHGARILAKRDVVGIDTSKGRVCGVRLAGPEEVLEAELVVLAAGAWSEDLARNLGVALPLQPAKGYSATMDRFDGAPELPVLVKERRVIVTPLDDRVRFGGTLELAGFEESVHGARYEAVVAGGAEALRTPPPRRNEESWSGLRPVTPDGLPVIDRSRSVEGLVVAAGHAMLGFTQSPATGQLVAELARGEATSLDASPFRLDRF